MLKENYKDRQIAGGNKTYEIREAEVQAVQATSPKANKPAHNILKSLLLLSIEKAGPDNQSKIQRDMKVSRIKGTGDG